MSVLLRKGDIISVNGKVKYDQEAAEKTVLLDIDGYYSSVLIKADLVTLIAPRIDVGERVRWKNGVEGRVLGSDVDQVWVKTKDDGYVTWPAKEVTIIPPKAADPDPIEPPPAPLDGKVGSEEEPDDVV